MTSLSLNDSWADEQHQSGFISDEVRQIFITVNWAIICAVICCFGIFANTVNIIVFGKLGFQDTVNVSLFALALSDLGSVVTLLWMSICVNPLFQYADTHLLTVEIQNVSGGWPHIICVKVTGWLTTFVTFERCLCVISPLKVKSVLTPTRVKAIVFSINLLVTVSMLPSMANAKLGWKFVPERNRTMIGMIVSELSMRIDAVTFTIHTFLSTLVILALTLIFTLILVVSLRKQSKWRQDSTANKEQGQQTLVRDQKLIKMLVIIATVFIICLAPLAALSIPVIYAKEFNVLGRYSNLYLVAGSIGLTLESVNSSVNIIIYYKMNSRYKSAFREMFSLRE